MDLCNILCDCHWRYNAMGTMVDEMTSKVAKRGRKAWRKRKLRQQARKDSVPLVLGLTTPPWEDMLPHELHEQWPQWKQRALPLPKYGT
jgi:hypothetical protein